MLRMRRIHPPLAFGQSVRLIGATKAAAAISRTHGPVTEPDADTAKRTSIASHTVVIALYVYTIRTLLTPTIPCARETRCAQENNREGSRGSASHADHRDGRVGWSALYG